MWDGNIYWEQGICYLMYLLFGTHGSGPNRERDKIPFWFIKMYWWISLNEILGYHPISPAQRNFIRRKNDDYDRIKEFDQRNFPWDNQKDRQNRWVVIPCPFCIFFHCWQWCSLYSGWPHWCQSNNPTDYGFWAAIPDRFCELLTRSVVFSFGSLGAIRVIETG